MLLIHPFIGCLFALVIFCLFRSGFELLIPIIVFDSIYAMHGLWGTSLTLTLGMGVLFICTHFVLQWVQMYDIS